MLRKLVTIVLFLMSLLLIAGCGARQESGPAATATAKMKVVASIYPVYEFACQVGGDKIEVSMLIPPGAEPHDWEPSARDLVKIKNAKLFLYNGAGLEPLDKLLKPEVLGQAAAVEVTKGMKLLKGTGEDEEHDHDHDKDKPGTNKHNHEVDPHVWLDPELAKQEVDAIAAAFVQMDAANELYYRGNANRYKQELTKLDEEYRTALAGVSRRDIVTTHAAFQYLAKRYQLHQVPMMGLAPDAEPTPERLATIVRFCREKQVTAIFFETLVSPKVAQTIAKETGVKLLVLNPIDGLTEADIKQGKNYLTIMRENLANLKNALQ